MSGPLQRSNSFETLSMILDRKSSADLSPYCGGQGSLVTQIRTPFDRGACIESGASEPSAGLPENDCGRLPEAALATTAPAPSTTTPESGGLSVKAQGKQPMALGQEAEPRAPSELASPAYVDVPDTPDTCDRTPLPENTPPNSHYRAYSRSGANGRRSIAPMTPPPPIGTAPASPVENGAQQLFFHGIGDEGVDAPAAAFTTAVSPSRATLAEQQEECTDAGQPAQPLEAAAAEKPAVTGTGEVREAAIEEVAARVAAAVEAEAEATVAVAAAAAARAAEATAGATGAAAAGAAARAAQATAVAAGSAMGGAAGAIARKQLSVICDFVAMDACELSAAAGSKLELVADQRTAGRGWCAVRDVEGRTGLIPESFVELCQRRTTAKVRHNFAAEEDNELTVQVAAPFARPMSALPPFLSLTPHLTPRIPIISRATGGRCGRAAHSPEQR